MYEVYEVQEKNPKIVYEDEVQVSSSMQSNAFNPMVDPEKMLVVPDSVAEMSIPQYSHGASVGLKRQEYSDYNPNLEGIFGPKMQWQQWG